MVIFGTFQDFDFEELVFGFRVIRSAVFTTGPSGHGLIPAKSEGRQDLDIFSFFGGKKGEKNFYGRPEIKCVLKKKKKVL